MGICRNIIGKCCHSCREKTLNIGQIEKWELDCGPPRELTVMMLRRLSQSGQVPTFRPAGPVDWTPTQQPASQPARVETTINKNILLASPGIFSWSPEEERKVLASQGWKSFNWRGNCLRNCPARCLSLWVSEITRKSSQLVKLYTASVSVYHSPRPGEQNVNDNKEFQFTKQGTNNILSKTWYFMIYCFSAGLRESVDRP